MDYIYEDKISPYTLIAIVESHSSTEYQTWYFDMGTNYDIIFDLANLLDLDY